MKTEFSAFVHVHLLGDIATHPLVRLLARLPLYPQGVGRGCKAAKAATTTLYPQGAGRIRKAAKAATTTLYPRGVGRIRKAAKAATTPLSRIKAGLGLPPRCVASSHTIRRTIGRAQLRFPG